MIYIGLIKRILKIFRQGRRCLRRRAFVIPGFSHVYKVQVGASSSRIGNEFLANEARIDQYGFWCNRAVCLKMCTPSGSPVVVGKSYKLDRQATTDEVDRLMYGLAQDVDAFVSVEFVDWKNSFDRVSLETALDVLGSKESEFVLASLCGLKLPVTGAHGDLIDRNIMVSKDGEPKIIDWEFYKPFGSVLTDLLRNHNYRLKKFHNTDLFDPWFIVRAGVPPALKRGELLSKYTNDISQLGILNALSNVCTAEDQKQLIQQAERFKIRIRERSDGGRLLLGG
ncbi:hypothetical protein [Thioalkalivibrio sp. ALE17]|uniref:hypothetical protein n=1 Tax=Thioalkalivibrio sp. ALE17 TaxID=1158173 RepID=UPI0018CB03E4|nr:hypothetical protein [Thioalkalivibrio sp. ALE17]